MGVCSLMSISTIGGYYPYTIVVYQIYLALVESKGELPVRSSGAAIFLMVSKALSVLLHAATIDCRRELRGLKLQLLCFTAMTVVLFTIAARSDVEGYGTLACVCMLPLTTSRALSSCLMAAPSEKEATRRIIFYDLAAAPGCLWTAVVIFLLATEPSKSSWLLRALVLNLPVLLTFMAWMLFPSSEFYGPSRLAEIQGPEKGTIRLHASLLQAPGGGFSQQVTEHVTEHVTTVSVRRPAFARSGAASFVVDEEAEIPWAWFNPIFRILAATHSVIFWCFAGVLYTVFPLLASESGPTLDVINAAYCIEGGVLALVTALIAPLVGKRVAPEFFGSVWTVLAFPVVVVWTMGKVHWSMYLVALLFMDVLSNLSNALIGVLMLRCFDWHCIPAYSSQINMMGGIVAGLSFLPVFLFDLLESWDWAVLVGQSVPAGLLLLLYATHWKALREIFRMSCNQDVKETPPASPTEGACGPKDLETAGDGEPEVSVEHCDSAGGCEQEVSEDRWSPDSLRSEGAHHTAWVNSVPPDEILSV